MNPLPRTPSTVMPALVQPLRSKSAVRVLSRAAPVVCVNIAGGDSLALTVGFQHLALTAPSCEQVNQGAT